MSLIIRNALRFTAMEGLGTIFIFIGTLIVVSGTTFLAYLDMTTFKYFADVNISSPIIPLAFVLLISYFVTSKFNMVLGIALEAIMHCFILDEEMQKYKSGGSAKASHTPPEL